MIFDYLHETSPGNFYLDHRLVPEVRAMFAAMASRAPVGGIKARYSQIVEAVYEDMCEQAGLKKDSLVLGGPNRGEAEFRLTVYPLHKKVQKFFDDFVLKYGHSSIMELTGDPAVYTEGISWFTAWLLFDSPICAGQEFSTRAVQHKDWPLARECILDPGEVVCYHIENGTTPDQQKLAGIGVAGATVKPEPHPELAALHDDWFEIFEAEVKWWTEHFSVPENREALGIKDKEPFRPALDRARWALPGTIATGCAHTTSLRERARVLETGMLMAQASGAQTSQDVWQGIQDCYRRALPGLAGMGLREAVYTPESLIPGHLRSVFTDAEEGEDVEIEESYTDGLHDVQPFVRTKANSYLDPLANTIYRLSITFRCSLAVARDWHRHRTLFPWHLQVVRERGTGCLMIDHHYEPKSEVALLKLNELLIRSSNLFQAFMDEGNVMQAALCLPLGTRVRLRGQGGLRDVLYMLELRKNAIGANFEYKEQATTGLSMLREIMGLYRTPYPEIDTIRDLFGIAHD